MQSCFTDYHVQILLLQMLQDLTGDKSILAHEWLGTIRQQVIAWANVNVYTYVYIYIYIYIWLGHSESCVFLEIQLSSMQKQISWFSELIWGKWDVYHKMWWNLPSIICKFNHVNEGWKFHSNQKWELRLWSCESRGLFHKGFSSWNPNLFIICIHYVVIEFDTY